MLGKVWTFIGGKLIGNVTPKLLNKIRFVLAKNGKAEVHHTREIVCVMKVKNVKNIALATSLVAFAIGFSEGGETMFWHLGRPVGAILFAVYMIFMVLEKETALLDEQQRVAKGKIEGSFGIATRLQKSSHKENCAPALTTASSH